MIIKSFVVIAFFLQSLAGVAQKDSTYRHSPKKAAILSAVLPGAGQIYNKAYWKLPIVYGGMGASTAFIFINNKQFNLYRNEYLYRLDHNGMPGNLDLERFTNDNLLTLQDTYRRWRDLSVIITAGLYVFQLVDAIVDAHLYEFDVSDDLSLRWQPSFQSFSGHSLSAGLSFTLQFK